MKLGKVRIVCILIGLLAVGTLAAAHAAFAQTATFGVPGAVLICLKPSIPFVWIRTAPSSYAGVRLTLFPQDYAKLTKNTVGATFDGVQWWDEVNAFPTASTFVSGWVEDQSVADANDGPSTQCPSTSSPNVPKPLLAGDVCLKPGIPFIWQRIAPSSYAPVEFTFTVFAWQPCVRSTTVLPLILVNGNHTYWDGVQWWVQIVHAAREYSSRAWVEANSLQPLP